MKSPVGVNSARDPRTVRANPTVSSLLRSIALLAALSGVASCRPANRASSTTDAGLVALPPPERPRDLLLSGRIARPSASVAALAQLAGARVPFELGMSLVLGFDATVISAVDLSRVMELVVTGQPGQGVVTLAFVPRSPRTLRAGLASRFRLVSVPGLGERLDPRGDNAPAGGWRCAIVSVPAPEGVRVACANDPGALARNGRWVAYASVAPRAITDDVVLDAEGPSARAALGPYLRRALSQGAAMLGQDTDEAPSNAPRTPGDSGDAGDSGVGPSWAPRMQGFIDEVDPTLADVRGVSIRLGVDDRGMRVELSAALDPAGRSTLARESARRVNASGAHPLAGRLAPNAAVAFASRSTAEGTRSIARALLSRALRAAGSEAASAVAEADVDALFARAGDAVALSLTREAPPERPPVPRPRADLERLGNDSRFSPTARYEATALVPLDDGGSAARAELRRLAAAPWLRQAALSVTTGRDALTVRPARAAGRATAGREVTLAVSRGALALLWGPDTRAQLRALDARTEGPPPATIEGAEAPMVLGVDVLSLARGQPGAPVRFTWGASREGDALRSTVRFELGGPLLRALRGLLPGR